MQYGEALMTQDFFPLDRRSVVKTALSSAALAALPSGAVAMGRAAHAPVSRFGGLLGQFAEEILRLTPETATSLGLDSGAWIGLKSQLGDGSPVGEAKWTAQVKSMGGQPGDAQARRPDSA
jgi:hypothetical protein